MNINKLRFSIFSIVLFLALIFSGNIYKIKAEETRIMYIDYPKVSQTYNNSEIYISGWALDKSVIKQVEVYKDGIKIGDAEYGIERSDVNTAYPGYPSGDKSGYKFTISKENVSDGYHTLKVKVIGTNLGYLEKSVPILMKKLPQKLYVDYPALNQNFKNEDIRVSGWTTNNSGVKQVLIYLDNQFKGQGTYGLKRTDVNKIYPGYPSEDFSGYTYNIDHNLITPGKHVIKVKAIGIDGGISEYNRTIYVTKMPSLIYVDSPKESQNVIGKTITISGWAVNPSGVKNISVYVDKILRGQATYGNKRTDVNKIYPGYPSGDNSGFAYNLDVSTLTSGNHEIKTEAVGNDGTVYSTLKNVIICKLVPKVYIDSPVNYQLYNNKDITVSGWSSNEETVKNIEILVDNKVMGQATYGLLRADVNKAYPGYPSMDNSGYSYNIDIDLVAPGNHLIKVISNGSDGVSIATSRWITVKKPEKKATIEYPNLTKYYNDVLVSGWALNSSGITKIDILLDGKVVGQATYGILRTDVNKTYSGYPSGDNSGYRFVINKDIIASGYHTVGIKIYGTDGTYQTISKNIAYEKLDNKIKLESPTVNYTSSNQDIIVKGYALIPSGAKRIDVILDNIKIGEAVFDLSRSDVSTLYPQYTNSKTSGFNYVLDADSIAPGTHNLNVKVYGIDGTSIETASSFILNKSVPRIYIDSPKDSALYYMEGIRISGWALNSSAVKNINIYLNNKILGQATLGLTRLDVDKAYPGYKDGTTSGYNYLISKSILVTGTYTIKVEQIGYDGTILSLTKTISVDMDKISTITTNYNYQIETILLKQLAAKPQIYISGIGWTNAGVDDVRYYLDPNNFKDNATYKYQFLVLNYTPGITLNEINTILTGKGVLAGYGSSFLNAAISNNVSVAYTVSHSLLETGNGTSQLANGVLVLKVNGVAVTPKVVYNMFGIGAYDSDPITKGAEYAYNKGWFTKAAAIEGGIKWISDDYINDCDYKQNTLYKMRWNPENKGISSHQYATDVKWANSQTYNIKKYMDLYPNAKLVFDIPEYKIN